MAFKTRIDADNVPYMDEPWSRPGDYVLLRALTDLVCFSSACPDDIDPANGWNPTCPALVPGHLFPDNGTLGTGCTGLDELST